MTDPLPISALQHLIFCERQCALIHIEGLWAENRLTVEGHALHRKAHGEQVGPRGGRRSEARPSADRQSTVRTVRGLALCSDRLGLIGKADVVEFRSVAPGTGSETGLGVPFPIEYKRGKPKRHDADLVQLCAQALCLEEMLRLPQGGVPRGALFYGLTRRRVDVTFDAVLRERTSSVIARLRELITRGVTPRASRDKKCERCSMLNLCLPDATGPEMSAKLYLERMLRDL